MKIQLQIRGLQDCPSFKNSKQIIRKGNHPSLITKPERRKWMDRATLLLESGLRSELETKDIAIPTGPYRLSLIASLMPLDDSWQWIREISVNVLPVSKGDEGADITIERIDEKPDPKTD